VLHLVPLVFGQQPVDCQTKREEWDHAMVHSPERVQAT
jgi:hypothetical protein